MKLYKKVNFMYRNVNYVFIAVMGLMLSACSVTYDSKHECERNLASDRGAIVGAVAGGQVGGGTGQAVGSVTGGAVGHVVGQATYSADDENDFCPYRRRRLVGVFAGCKPVE